MDVALLTQDKDANKEKWQTSRRKACFTLSIEGIFIERVEYNIYQKFNTAGKY